MRDELILRAHAWLLSIDTCEAGAPHTCANTDGTNLVFEWWNKTRKISVWFEADASEDIILCVWGPNIHDNMSEHPTSKESADKCFEWMMND